MGSKSSKLRKISECNFSIDPDQPCDRFVSGMHTVHQNIPKHITNTRIIKLITKNHDGNQIIYCYNLMEVYDYFRDDFDRVFRHPVTNEECVLSRESRRIINLHAKRIIAEQKEQDQTREKKQITKIHQERLQQRKQQLEQQLQQEKIKQKETMEQYEKKQKPLSGEVQKIVERVKVKHDTETSFKSFDELNNATKALIITGLQMDERTLSALCITNKAMLELCENTFFSMPVVSGEYHTIKGLSNWKKFMHKYWSDLYRNVNMKNEDDFKRFVRQFIEFSPNVNMRLSPYYKTVLGDALWLGYNDIIQELIDAGASVDYVGANLLIDAAERGRDKAVKRIIDAGVNLNLQDYTGNTALMRAVYKDQPEIAEELINAGANLDLQNGSGKNALMLAISANNIDSIDKLIKAGANLNIQNFIDGHTALMEALFMKNPEIFERLIETGADLNLQTISGDTVLNMAIKQNMYNSANKLVKAGANLDLQDENGNTALMTAIKKGGGRIVKQLIDAGANLDLQNLQNETALMMAAETGNNNILEYFIEAGANLNLRNDYGDTALMIARKNSDVSESARAFVKQLIAAGADQSSLQG